MNDGYPSANSKLKYTYTINARVDLFKKRMRVNCAKDLSCSDRQKPASSSISFACVEMFALNLRYNRDETLVMLFRKCIFSIWMTIEPPSAPIKFVHYHFLLRCTKLDEECTRHVSEDPKIALFCAPPRTGELFSFRVARSNRWESTSAPPVTLESR